MVLLLLLLLLPTAGVTDECGVMRPFVKIPWPLVHRPSDVGRTSSETRGSVVTQHDAVAGRGTASRSHRRIRLGTSSSPASSAATPYCCAARRRRRRRRHRAVPRRRGRARLTRPGRPGQQVPRRRPGPRIRLRRRPPRRRLHQVMLRRTTAQVCEKRH